MLKVVSQILLKIKSYIKPRLRNFKKKFLIFAHRGGIVGWVLTLISFISLFSLVEANKVKIQGDVHGIWKASVIWCNLDSIPIDTFTIYYLFTEINNTSKKPFHLNSINIETMEDSSFHDLIKIMPTDSLLFKTNFLTYDDSILLSKILFKDTIIQAGNSIDVMILGARKGNKSASIFTKKLKMRLFDKANRNYTITTDLTKKEVYSSYDEMQRRLNIRFRSVIFDKIDSTSTF